MSNCKEFYHIRNATKRDLEEIVPDAILIPSVYFGTVGYVIPFDKIKLNDLKKLQFINTVILGDHRAFLFPI